jgi:hypothetical protein
MLFGAYSKGGGSSRTTSSARLLSTPLQTTLAVGMPITADLGIHRVAAEARIIGGDKPRQQAFRAAIDETPPAAAP